MEDKERKLEEIQILEQNLQNILIQKQAFQMELSETLAALKELGKSKGDSYKIIGQFMIKKEKNEIRDELKNKEKIINLRISALDKQEKAFAEKSEKLRKDFLNNTKKE